MDALNAADIHINKLTQTIKTQDLLIQHLERSNVALRTALDEANEEVYHWSRNPAITITMGLLIGFTIGAQR